MKHEEAVGVLDVVQAGWAWQMSQMTQDVWLHSLEKWEDAEAAEVAVIELVGQLTHRPTLGVIREHYDAVVRRFKHEQAPLSAAAPIGQLTGPVRLPATPDLAWSIEGARWAAGVRDLTDDEVAQREDEARAAYLTSAPTSKDRQEVVTKKLHELIDRKIEEAAGKVGA